MNPVEIVRMQFKAAAGEAAGLELSMRMLADKVPRLHAFAHSKKFEDIEDEIIKYFLDLLTDEDKKTLYASPGIHVFSPHLQGRRGWPEQVRP
jgi:hypothetical protein